MAILTLDRSRLDKLAKVNTVELLSMLTTRGKLRGVMLAQFAQFLTGVGIILPWKPFAGHASWSGQARRTGNSPEGGLGMYSD